MKATEPTGIPLLDQLDADIQARVEVRPTKDAKMAAEAETYAKYGPELRALILQYRAERDAWLQQHAQDTVRFTRERDALVEALRTKIEEWRGRVEHEDAIYRANPYGLGGSYGRPVEECIDDIEDILAAALLEEEARDD